MFLFFVNFVLRYILKFTLPASIYGYGFREHFKILRTFTL